MADIASDGPFSPFPGVERWFAVVTGAGVVLTLDGHERLQTAGDAPLRFDGAATPGCRLVDGPTRDLNLMLKGGRGAMRPVVPGTAWREDYEMRGLFTATPGLWSGEGDARTLAGHTLLWVDGTPAGRWSFKPGDSAIVPAGWWLAFSL